MEVFLAIIFVAAAAMILPGVIRYILKERYFASDEFLAHKRRIASVVAEHNEIAKYVSEIRNRGSFTVGASSSGTQSHLAMSQNTRPIRDFIPLFVERGAKAELAKLNATALAPAY